MSEMSDTELVRHIADCRFLMKLAQARFRGSRSAQDAREAQQWERALIDAIKARQAAYRERIEDEASFSGEWAMRLAQEVR